VPGWVLARREAWNLVISYLLDWGGITPGPAPVAETIVGDLAAVGTKELGHVFLQVCWSSVLAANSGSGRALW